VTKVKMVMPMKATTMVENLAPYAQGDERAEPAAQPNFAPLQRDAEKQSKY
jgi:hypothetical protein